MENPFLESFFATRATGGLYQQIATSTFTASAARTIPDENAHLMNPEPRRQFLRQIASASIALSAASAFGQKAESGRKRIKVGQIGVKHAHASKLQVYRQSSDYEVVG